MHKRSEYLWGVISIAVILIVLILCAFLTNRAVNTYSTYVHERNAHCIVIDAGHGGVDGGAISCTGVYESQINLQISLRLNDLLQLLGYRTRMIRTEDISVYTTGDTISEKKISDLKERVRIINKTNNAVLISIHQNYFQDTRYSGAQIFFAEESQDFAMLVQSQFLSTLNPSSKRKCKKTDGIYLMEHIHCPGILVECGFLSNQAEESNLRDPSYQKKITCVIACATSQYLSNKTIA